MNIAQLFYGRNYLTAWVGLTFTSSCARAFNFLLFALIPRCFGVGLHTDIFFAGLNLANRTRGYLLCTNMSVIVPVAMEEGRTRGLREGSNLYSRCFSRYMLAALFLVAVFHVLPYSWLELILGFPRSELRSYSAIVALLTVLFVADVALFGLNDWAFANRYFSLPSTLGSIASVAAVLWTLALPSGGLAGLLSILIGLRFAQIVAVLHVLSANVLFSIKPRRSVSRVSMRGPLLVYIGALFTLLFDSAPYLLVSRLGPGQITALAYAQVIASIPATLIVEHSQQMVAVRMAEFGREGAHDSLNSTFRSLVEHLLLLIIPVCGFLWIVREPLLDLLLSSQTPSEIRRSATDLVAYLIWIPPLTAVNSLVSRLFLGLQRVAPATLYQICSNSLGVVFLVTGILFGGSHAFGPIMLAFYAVHLVALYFLCRAVFPWFQYASGVSTAWKGTLLTIPALCLAGSSSSLSESPLYSISAAAVVYGGAVVITYLVVQGMTRGEFIPEAARARNLIRKTLS